MLFAYDQLKKQEFLYHEDHEGTRRIFIEFFLSNTIHQNVVFHASFLCRQFCKLFNINSGGGHQSTGKLLTLSR
jgi:hypothetical protein